MCHQPVSSGTSVADDAGSEPFKMDMTEGHVWISFIEVKKRK